MRRLLTRRFGSFRLERAADPGRHASRLRAYFAGEMDAFRDARLSLGGTPFQRTVWAALRRIPPATTMTYGELARSIGRPAAARAVGRASGSNPITIVVPCHRLIGASGDLTGYAQGIERKRFLLAHEAAADLRACSRATSSSRTLACSPRVSA
jgi:methylated-DNA-[protein]-cysteine S-methyltransferase